VLARRHARYNCPQSFPHFCKSSDMRGGFAEASRAACPRRPPNDLSPKAEDPTPEGQIEKKAMYFCTLPFGSNSEGIPHPLRIQRNKGLTLRVNPYASPVPLGRVSALYKRRLFFTERARPYRNAGTWCRRSGCRECRQRSRGRAGCWEPRYAWSCGWNG